MRIIVTVLSVIFLLIINLPAHVYAASDRAYTDYLYQFDQYRIALNEFKVARDEYAKFKTLISQTDALEKTIKLLEIRDVVLRTYLVFLDEKLSETTALSPSNVALYKSLLQNEITFLNNHSKLILAIGSIEDAEDVSRQLSSHYNVLQATIHQTIVALTVGELQKVDVEYQRIFTNIQLLIQKSRADYSPEKQSTVDRWLLQIQNKRSLFAQKIDQIQSLSVTLARTSAGDMSDKFLTIQKNLNEAKQYQLEGIAFLGELKELLKYNN